MQLGLQISGPTVENIFNDIWANNGDTISLCYAHTSALKGDFVRTGKRDLSGMVSISSQGHVAILNAMVAP